MIESGPWCVVLARRDNARLPVRIMPRQPAPARKRDPLTDTLQRAATISPGDQIGAVVAGRAEQWRRGALSHLAAHNVFFQPSDQGTGFEVLLALMHLETRVSPEAQILFLPSDHVVGDEHVFTQSLSDMVKWMTRDARPVYLLGAVPEGPHDRLGYIVPWYDAMQMATGVYEFVEEPDVGRARKLINSGGLWNTFIFGGSLSSLVSLFRPRFDAVIEAMRAALRTASSDPMHAAAIRRVYAQLTPVDFSHDLLATQADRLNVLRMPRCGWWPLKAPKRWSNSLGEPAG